MHINHNLPIGIFDSGIGGLTVLKALQDALPCESFVYLGDTARLPYGLKGEHTIIRYAHQAAKALIDQKIKMLVIACNTASAYALAELKQSFPELPIIGVIEPGARAACQTTQSQEIIVLATEATIKIGAYQTAIAKINPKIRVLTKACSMFIPLAEEGWLKGHIAEAIAREYIEPLLATEHGIKPDCIVLGCTHFPALRDTIAQVAGPNMRLVDSAQTTAQEVVTYLQQHQLLTESKSPQLQFFATDVPERFAKTASYFLGRDLAAGDITLIDL
jgi:glutamate racemase